MTNFEYYKDEILEITNKGNAFGLYKSKPISCIDVKCVNCDFSSSKKHNNPCSVNRMKWLYEEYVKPPKQPKLTKKERQLCELVETGWITRDESGCLNYYIKKPEKRDQYKYGYWVVNSDDDKKYNNNISSCLNTPFSFITWDDAEPWSIEDLLKLEVEE